MVVWMGLSAPPIGGWLVDFNSYGVQVLWGLFFEQFHRTCPFPIVSVRCSVTLFILKYTINTYYALYHLTRLSQYKSILRHRE